MKYTLFTSHRQTCSTVIYIHSGSAGCQSVKDTMDFSGFLHTDLTCRTQEGNQLLVNCLNLQSV